MFRITPQYTNQTAITHSRRLTVELARLQTQASSGLRFERPSDSPIDSARAGILNRQIGVLESQQRAIQDAEQTLNASVSVITEFNNLLTRAKQISLDGPQGLGQGDRETLANEVDSMVNRMLDLMNYQENGRYLFSGQAYDQRPFGLVERNDGSVGSLNYLGSHSRAGIRISESLYFDTFFSGLEIFGQDTRGDSLYLGETGAAAGTGTDSLEGRINLEVFHEATTFTPGSGVVSPASATNANTIIGPSGANFLNLVDTSGTGTSGTVSLNDGSIVSWTSADSDLQVLGPRNEVVRLDLSNITPGFNGRVDIEAEGSLSIDGGVTRQTIDFSSNQTLTTSLGPGVLNVDSSEIRRAGTEPVEFENTANPIVALQELRDDLRNVRDLPDHLLSEALERRVSDISRSSTAALDLIGQLSVPLQDLDQLSFRNEARILEANSQKAEVESADMVSVIVGMQSLQTTLQFNYASLSIVESTSLLDFLG